MSEETYGKKIMVIWEDTPAALFTRRTTLHAPGLAEIHIDRLPVDAAGEAAIQEIAGTFRQWVNPGHSRMEFFRAGGIHVAIREGTVQAAFAVRRHGMQGVRIAYLAARASEHQEQTIRIVLEALKQYAVAVGSPYLTAAWEDRAGGDMADDWLRTVYRQSGFLVFSGVDGSGTTLAGHGPGYDAAGAGEGR